MTSLDVRHSVVFEEPCHRPPAGVRTGRALFPEVEEGLFRATLSGSAIQDGRGRGPAVGQVPAVWSLVLGTEKLSSGAEV